MFEIKPRTSILVVRTDCVLTGLICWYVLVEVVESQVWLAVCGDSSASHGTGPVYT